MLKSFYTSFQVYKKIQKESAKTLASFLPRSHTGGPEAPDALCPGLLGHRDQVHGAGHQDVVPGPVLAPQVTSAHP